MYQPHFTHEETDSKDVSDMPSVTQQWSQHSDLPSDPKSLTVLLMAIGQPSSECS